MNTRGGAGSIVWAAGWLRTGLPPIKGVTAASDKTIVTKTNPRRMVTSPATASVIGLLPRRANRESKALITNDSAARDSGRAYVELLSTAASGKLQP